MNTSCITTVGGHLQKELPICLFRGIGVCLMGLPFFADRGRLHIGSSILLGSCFALAFDRIEHFLPISLEEMSSTEHEDSGRVSSTRHETRTEGTVPFKLVFRLLLAIPSLLLGFRIFSPMCGLHIPIRHDLSLQCGTIQLCISALIALQNLLCSAGKKIPYVKAEEFDRSCEEAQERIEELSQQLGDTELGLNNIAQEKWRLEYVLQETKKTQEHTERELKNIMQEKWKLEYVLQETKKTQEHTERELKNITQEAKAAQNSVKELSQQLYIKELELKDITQEKWGLEYMLQETKDKLQETKKTQEHTERELEDTAQEKWRFEYVLQATNGELQETREAQKRTERELKYISQEKRKLEYMLQETKDKLRETEETQEHTERKLEDITQKKWRLEDILQETEETQKRTEQELEDITQEKQRLESILQEKSQEAETDKKSL